MPTVPISMRKLKEILRLKYGVGLSHRQIGRSLAISPSVVSRYANRAAQLGIKQWPLPTGWDDTKLKHAFLQTQVKMKKHSLPDWATVHRELRNKCVTLQLLWEEYCERNPGGFYSYNHYCRMYREWLKTTSPSMRQVHKAGEKLFVDYCGPTVGVTDPETGEIRTAQVIVAVLGASSYTWAEATWSQQLEDWVMSHVRCFQWLGGVPELVVPDNLKSATSRACKYDPDVNPTYQQMLEHYNVAVLPARPRKPKDKAKAEVGVQVVERWIMARIRHEIFYSLASLNQRIRELLERLNNKIMQKLGYSRAELFIQLDKPALKPLPEASYSYTLVKKVRVHADYHVEIDKHYYSVPCSLLGQQLEAWISGELVRLFNQGQEVAVHPRKRTYGYPPTVNTYWRRHGNTYFISEAGKRYRRDVVLIVRQQRLKLNLSGRLAIKVIAEPPDKRRRDLDNILKAPLDALTHAGVLMDDEQFDEINIVRGQPVSGGRLGVKIYPIMH